MVQGVDNTSLRKEVLTKSEEVIAVVDDAEADDDGIGFAAAAAHAAEDIAANRLVSVALVAVLEQRDIDILAEGKQLDKKGRNR